MDICGKFLKLCGKIFGNIWDYFTNIYARFSDFFCLGGEVRGNKMLEFLERFKDSVWENLRSTSSCHRKNFRKRVYFGRSMKMVLELMYFIDEAYIVKNVRKGSDKIVRTF